MHVIYWWLCMTQHICKCRRQGRSSHSFWRLDSGYLIFLARGPHLPPNTIVICMKEAVEEDGNDKLLWLSCSLKNTRHCRPTRWLSHPAQLLCAKHMLNVPVLLQRENNLCPFSSQHSSALWENECAWLLLKWSLLRHFAWLYMCSDD